MFQFDTGRAMLLFLSRPFQVHPELGSQPSIVTCKFLGSITAIPIFYPFVTFEAYGVLFKVTLGWFFAFVSPPPTCVRFWSSLGLGKIWSRLNLKNHRVWDDLAMTL